MVRIQQWTWWQCGPSNQKKKKKRDFVGALKFLNPLHTCIKVHKNLHCVSAIFFAVSYSLQLPQWNICKYSVCKNNILICKYFFFEKSNYWTQDFYSLQSQLSVFPLFSPLFFTFICWISDQDWLPNCFWCQKSCVYAFQIFNEQGDYLMNVKAAL